MPGKDRVSKVINMNSYVMRNIIEYIGSQEDMPFDAVDIEESLEEVLAHFDLHPELCGRERDALKNDLLRLALKRELKEMREILDLGLTSGVKRVGLRLYPLLFEKGQPYRPRERRRSVGWKMSELK